MKRSKKITIGIVIFFLVIALVIVGRYAVGLYFKKKFSKRPLPEIVVEVVANKKFNQSLICPKVLSPTPMVLISGDSITVMSFSGNVLIKVAAVIQPALPPPTINILLSFMLDNIGVSCYLVN